MAKTIQDYKNDYAAAQARGDKAGMAAANNGANALRQQQGQNVQVADVTKEVYGNNYVGSSGSSSGGNNSASQKDNSKFWQQMTGGTDYSRRPELSGQTLSQNGVNVSYNDKGYAGSGVHYDNDFFAGTDMGVAAPSKDIYDSTADRSAWGGSVYDQSHFSDTDLKNAAYIRQKAQQGLISWDQANKYVESIRSKYGYSGGQDGSKYVPLEYYVWNPDAESKEDLVKAPFQGVQNVGVNYDWGGNIPAGYGGTGSTGAMSGSTTGGGGVEDLSQYLQDMYSAQKDAAIAAIQNAYQQNVAAIDSAKGQIAPQYQSARNEAAGASEQSARNFAEYAAAYGLGSGSSAQADLARNIALQNNLNDLNAQEADAYTQLELQKQQAEIEYNNAIAEAEASNNSELASALYQEKVRVQNALIQQQQTLFEQALSEKQFQFQQQQADVSNSQWQQQFDYQKQQDQLSAEQQNKQYLAAWGESMLENGFMPTEEMLAAMGLSSDQAQAYINFYKQMAAANAASSSGSSKKSSSGSSKSSSSSGSYSGSYSGSGNTQNNANQSYNIDMNSVLQLGYGPIDSDSLANLEAQGKIESYTDGNLIKFRKVSTPSNTTTTQTSNMFLPSLGLLGR